MKRFIVVGLLGLVASANAMAALEDAGLLLSVSGKVEILANGGSEPASQFRYLRSGDRLRVPDGAKLTMTFYATRELYEMEGPAEIELTANTVVAISGKVPTKQSMQDIQIRAASITQRQTARPGAVSLRSPTQMIASIEPEFRSTVLSEHPTLAWRTLLPPPYQIVILDGETKEEVARSSVTEPKFAPPGNGLARGRTYNWRVYAGSIESPTYIFAVADERDLREVKQIQPSETDNDETWLLYAAVLRGKRMDDEAKTALDFVRQRDQSQH